MPHWNLEIACFLYIKKRIAHMRSPQTAKNAPNIRIADVASQFPLQVMAVTGERESVMRKLEGWPLSVSAMPSQMM